jgi:c-di-AMP phosphodiesterase-like protein
MDFTSELTKIKDLTEKAQDILIVTHENPNFDSVGAALALYLGLSQLKKHVTIACPDPMTVELSSFVGVNRVVSTVNKKNFVISLDYVDGSIEKVSYNIAGDKFNLVVEPRNGYEPFSEEKVHFSHTGTSADLIFVIDTIHLGGLKNLYEQDKALYTTKPVINIDRHPNNAHFGEVNIVDATAAGAGELVAMVLSAMNIPFTEDISTNILNALYSVTNNFQNPAVSGRTFELAAMCMNAGGKKFQPPQSANMPVQNKPDTRQTVSTPAIGASPSVQTAPKQVFQPGNQTQQTQQPSVAAGQTPVKPQSQPLPQPQQPKTETAPADWLKPKIFKSSNNV